MSLFDTLIYEVAHCLTNGKHCECNHEVAGEHCVHFYEEETKLRSYLMEKGVTLGLLCIPMYIKKLHPKSKELGLGKNPILPRKQKRTVHSVSVRTM